MFCLRGVLMALNGRERLFSGQANGRLSGRGHADSVGSSVGSLMNAFAGGSGSIWEPWILLGEVVWVRLAASGTSEIICKLLGYLGASRGIL